MKNNGGPEIVKIPIGIEASGARREADSMGNIEIPADRYWGAQTQRSLVHFCIGGDRMSKEVYRAYGYVKKAAAHVNAGAGRLPRWKADVISQVSDEVIAGELDEHFPLYVWQTGSGTQSNMNLNEVISNRCIQLVGGELGSKKPIHPNDDVNMGQSSNDTFPTAMHIAAVLEIQTRLLPRVRSLQQAIATTGQRWNDVVKIGRTHLEDAVPLTVGQEWSGWAAQLDSAAIRVEASQHELSRLAAGGTAVGTGLNAPHNFGEDVAAEIAELTLPANEPGSSIMPGKVNPTQCEAMVMVCIQVIGDDSAVAFAGSQGNFQLNAMRPIVINNFLHSARILGDACEKLQAYCIEGIRLNKNQINEYVTRTLMLVTALSPVIGYDKASAIAHDADRTGRTLRESALESGAISAEDFDRIGNPASMVGPF
jgi:fumarate hydratase, class II